MATCLHPILVHGKLFPCGKCPVCRQNARQAKGDRFLLACAFNKANGGSNFFVTLTYSDDCITKCREPNRHDGPWYLCFNKRDVKTFFEYLRRAGVQCKYFISCEYGDNTHRPHMHALILTKNSYCLEHFSQLCNDCWKLGFTQVAMVNDSRVQYVSKYVLKDDPYYLSLPKSVPFRDVRMFDYRKPFQNISRGFGEDAIPYLNEYIYNDGENLRDYFEFNGKRVNFDSFIKRHIDPSISAELTVRYYEKENEIQSGLANSRIQHSKKVKFGDNFLIVPDMTRDDEIYKHRARLKSLKKLNKV